MARDHPDFDPLRALNYILGGSFSSRINLNLREDKGYTYGASSSFVGGRHTGRFVVATAVETVHVAAALGEILAELRRIHQGVAREEVDFARRALTQSLVRAFESGSARLMLLEAIHKYGLPADYPVGRRAWLDGMTADHLDGLAERHLSPNDLVVVVVGDAEASAAALAGLGQVIEVDPDAWWATE